MAWRTNPELALRSLSSGPTITPLLEDVPYGALAPIQVPPGAYVLSSFAAPSDCMGMPASFQVTPNLSAGNRYLAVATGELAPEDGDPSFKLAR